MVGGGIPVAIHSNVTGSVTLTTYPAKLSFGKIISGITVKEINTVNHMYIHTYIVYIYAYVDIHTYMYIYAYVHT